MSNTDTDKLAAEYDAIVGEVDDNLAIERDAEHLEQQEQDDKDEREIAALGAIIKIMNKVEDQLAKERIVNYMVDRYCWDRE